MPGHIKRAILKLRNKFSNRPSNRSIIVDRSFAEALKGAEIKSQKNMELMDKGGLRVSKK